MMTKKREMAEWILDFFRRAKVDAGQIIMFRAVQNKLLELTPKERDLFTHVANELISNGYFAYEEGSPQVLRLTQKGRDYIYTSNAELDCCYDTNKLSATQTKYIEEWHDSFVRSVNGFLAIIESLSLLPSATEEDKQGLALCQRILNGPDVNAIENSLAEAKVSKELLDMIESRYKRLVDVAVEHVKTDTLIKEFLKRLSYLKIEQDKQSVIIRLDLLKIPN